MVDASASPLRMASADPVDLIELRCFQCDSPWRVCPRDYRGQRYCGRECRELGYAAHTRRAGQKYQGTLGGLERHRRRQKALRDRRRHVTHGPTGHAPTRCLTVDAGAAKALSRVGEAPDGDAGRRLAVGDDDPPRAWSQGPCLGRCAICRRPGIVVLWISRQTPAGMRVPTHPRA